MLEYTASLQQAHYFEPWLNFVHPCVRQLAFAIASPNLIQHLPSELQIQHTFEFHSSALWQKYYTQYQTRLEELDQNPDPLLQFLAQLKSTRLGLRFEMLLWFWLQDNPQQRYHPYELLGHSLQQIDGARTLGELDFVVFNHQTQQVEHWEVALKYYLAECDYRLPHWYGLNRDDTFLKKLNHFTQRQFQFEHVLETNIQKKFAVLKGQLFLPVKTIQSVTAPTWINPARRLGLWGSFIPQQQIYRLSRHEWICPDRQPTSSPAQWWCNGLYYDTRQNLSYMYRQPALIDSVYKCYNLVTF
ncbi:DUF1853 family protein [Acinetobacter sp. MB5]|uniref:DUF1853 family protein n=1 Tax=Acinetobacter sp. MB5 TaxID=2069438 RepID=UPI000DD090B2|nr:DUF1853 family protein [Acinetobacter sp. MB5]